MRRTNGRKTRTRDSGGERESRIGVREVRTVGDKENKKKRVREGRRSEEKTGAGGRDREEKQREEQTETVRDRKTARSMPRTL